MAVVDEPIEDGIGERGFVDVGVPLVEGKLTGGQRGFLVVTILQDFQQIAFGLIGEWGQAEVRDGPTNLNSESRSVKWGSAV